MDGYFCAFQESQGGATTGNWQVTPTQKPEDYQKMLRVKENDDVKVFGFFYISRD